MRAGTTTSLDTARKEVFLLVARALADVEARIPTDRFADLVERLATADDPWLTRLLPWMARHASLDRLRLAATAELVHARLEAGQKGTRRIIDRALRRADEPGELLHYWLTQFGRAVPKPVKRGVADAVVRLYDERALATYDSPGAVLRFADVLALTHPVTHDAVQADVFRHAVARRRGTVRGIPESLVLLRARRSMYWVPAERRALLLERPDAADRLSRAAMPWPTVERWLLGRMTGPAWAAVLPAMPYRDRLAHLADFERDGLPEESARQVVRELAEPSSVIRAGVSPLEIFAALRAVPDSRWTRALRAAVELSAVNVPALPGRTLVLVDRTDLMAGPAECAPLTRAEAAAVFGAALAARGASVDLVEFGTAQRRVPAGPIRETVDRFGPVGGRADAAAVVRRWLDDHDRIVVLTHPDAAAQAAQAVTVPGHEHVITEPSCGWFAAIPHVEMARTANWPF
ncbi:TROVE domain-containing protein [Nonomuraea sp. B12E4]|uniref:TROVE domain-containing protein n=1 Tax=Nonomuraea sp. B12E4 TaxID=3153564 RepID=UPI00325DFB45